MKDTTPLLKLSNDFGTFEIRDPEFILTSIESDWTRIKHCINPTDEIAFSAIRQDPKAIEFIDEMECENAREYHSLVYG